MKKAFLLLSMALASPAVLLSSCASTAALPSPGTSPASEAGAFRPVYLTDKKAVSLLPTSALASPIDAYQHLVADFRGRTFETDCLLLADQHQLFMTILNEFGSTLGSLVYTADELSFETSLFPKQIPAEYIVFDVQLCYYRLADLQQALSAAGLRLEETVGSDGETRTVYDGRKELVCIEKSSGAITCTNFLRGYRYTLTRAN